MTSLAHCRDCQSHQLKLSKHEDLKLAFDFCVGQILRRAEMTAPGVVNHNVEMPGFRKRAGESVFDRFRIQQIELDRMEVSQLRYPPGFARCSPNFVASRVQRFRDGKTDP